MAAGLKELAEALLQTPHARPVSGGSEITVRCPYCGDSTKSNRSHMYVGMEKIPLVYDCKKCVASGILTPGVLTRLNIHDFELHAFVKGQMPRSFKKVLGDDGSQIIVTNCIYPEHRAMDKEKLDYLSERTGVDFYQKENVSTYKVITSLEGFLKINDIKEDNKNDEGKRMFKTLDDNYIGFLAHDQKSIQFRKVSGDGPRYYMYLLDDKRRSYFYTPDRPFNPISDNPEIVLTEGPIGSIVTMKQFYPSDADHIVFGAVGTVGGYRKALQRILELTCYYGSRVTIYSDQDVPLEKYTEEIFKPFIGQFDFSVYYNMISDDADFNDLRLGFEPKRKTF